MRDGGMGDLLSSYLIENNLLKNKIFKNLSINSFPKCGTLIEVPRSYVLIIKLWQKK